MNEKTVSVQLFMPNGGPQPEQLTPIYINHYFIGNFAKQWAMRDGYLPTFLSYENGIIQFKLVTDPRIEGVFWIRLCKFIAYQYKTHVALLKDATKFEVEHYMANDIIGFTVDADDTEKLNEYSDRQKAAYASLPSSPNLLHKGVIE